TKIHYTIALSLDSVLLITFSFIYYGLNNYCVKFMPFPVHDAMLCMKTAPERTENIMRRIQDTLYRNVSPMKYSNGQAFRLQQGFLLSSTQQQVDRLVLQTGEVVRTLKRSASGETDPNCNSLHWAEGLIMDAENSKQLISHLHDAVLRRDEAGNPIETKLNQISTDLHAVITNYLQDSVESMVRSAQDKCPNVLSDEKVVDDVRAACLAKSQVSSQVIEEAIVEQAGSLILNKVNEVNLAVASTVSDRVIDEVVHSLSNTCKNLRERERDRERENGGEGHLGDYDGLSSICLQTCADVKKQIYKAENFREHSNLATPQLASKRKSIHGRKLRPQSVVAESLDSVSELPSSCGQLQHLGKARPKRVKTRAPTRPMGRADLLEEEHDISEGVDSFFRPGSSTPTTPLISPDSENSPNLLKYGSCSSVESSSQTGCGPHTTSMDSLAQSDSFSRSDLTHESPRGPFTITDTQEEYYDDDDEEE
ncbi:unnamed protein product, partial [Meganyctiphanes norvegica]